MNINSRIKQYLKYKGISERKFSLTLGFSEGILKGMNTKSDKLAKILKAYPDLNVNWVLFGEGKMIKEPENMLKEPPAVYGQNYADKLIKCQERIIELQEQLSQANAEITNLRLQQKNIFNPKQKSELKPTENDTKKT